MRLPSLRSLAVAVAGTVLVLAAGEFAVRTWIETPSVAVPVARFEWAYPAHVRVVHSSEGYSVRRTNALGLFDDELRVPRPARRVLLLGDSYAEALQVPAGAEFAAIAERALPGTEIVNAGVSGHSPLDHAEWAETVGDSLRPDVIVVEVSDANLELMLTPAAQRRLDSPPAPGRLEPLPPETGVRAVMRAVLRNSALATLSWRRFKLLAGDQKASLSRRFNATGVRGPAKVKAVEDPRTPALLDGLQARLARRARHVVWLYIPHLEYFRPGQPPSDPRLAALLADLCARHGATFVDAGPAMREEYRRTGQPVHGFANSVVGSGHINAAGHRAVGEALAAALKQVTP